MHIHIHVAPRALAPRTPQQARPPAESSELADQKWPDSEALVGSGEIYFGLGGVGCWTWGLGSGSHKVQGSSSSGPSVGDLRIEG